MSTTSTRPYAVIGATGQQGAAVVDHLVAHDASVRALVRDTTSDRARALADRGVELATADQEQPDSLVGALAGVAGLFFMTTFAGDDGTAGEVRRGLGVVDAARRAGVPLVVYSSVGGAERSTGIPHFESKREVEEALAAAGIEHRIVRPTFFMDNLTAQLPQKDAGPEDVVLRLPMPGDVPLQLVAVRDIGAAAGAVLLDPAAIEGGAIEIAGDELTMDDVAARIGRWSGRPARYEAQSVEDLPEADLRAMFTWFVQTPAYAADLAATRRLVPQAMDVATWLEQTG